MKAKIGYWTTTGMLSVMMAGSAIAYLISAPQIVEDFVHLGYPGNFRMLLGAAKLLGVLAILAPRMPAMAREWAYAGFAITLVAAAVSHAATGDATAKVVMPLLALGLLAGSRALLGARALATSSLQSSIGSAQLTAHR